jgi:hypothetical protein
MFGETHFRTGNPYQEEDTMADSLIELQEIANSASLKMLLEYTSESARAVYAMDPREYGRSMDEVRGILGRLAESLEVREPSRTQVAIDEEYFPASTVQLH